MLVCALAIFLLSAMDAAMKMLVIAAGLYNAIPWRACSPPWQIGLQGRAQPAVLVLKHASRAAGVGIVSR